MKVVPARGIAVLLGVLLSSLGRLAAAQVPPPAAEAPTELTVISERGALLSMDGKPVGRLPLPTPLLVPGGAHRFAIERQSRRFESDLLSVPAGRVAELSLTAGTKGTAVAVLSLTPMILLALRPSGQDDALREALRRMILDAVRAEHAVLVPIERVVLLTATQPPNCLARLDCQLAVAQQLEARLVLVIGVPPPAAGISPGGPQPTCAVQGEVFDVGTGQRAGQLELPCGGGEDQVLETTLRLSRRLVSAVASLGKGTVEVTSTVAGARVVLDGRPRGFTPWQGPSLPGAHELIVTKEGAEPFRSTVNVSAAQLVTVAVEFAPPVVVAPPPVTPPPPPATPPPPLAVAPPVVVAPAPRPTPSSRGPRPR